MENGLYEMRIANLEANMKVLETKIQQLFEASKPVQESMVVSQVNLHTDMLSDFRRDLILLKNGLEWCEEHIKNLEGNATADSAEAFKEYDKLKADYNKCQEDLKKINDMLFNQAQETIGLCTEKNQLEVEIHSLKDELADKDKAIEILKKRINTLGEEKALLCQRIDKKIETLIKERDRLRELYFESIVKEETGND